MPWNSPGKNTEVCSHSVFQDPEIRPDSPALQVGSLPSEPPRKPKNTGVGSHSLLQGIFPTQGSNLGLLHCRQILYCLSHQGRPKDAAAKVLHSISKFVSKCKQICKTQQWLQNWKMSIFIPIPKKSNAKEYSDYRTILLMSHASKVKVKVTQSCLTLRFHGLYSPWDSPGQNTGVGSLFFLQGIFPTQGSNPGPLHCRWILYQLRTREVQEYWNG